MIAIVNRACIGYCEEASACEEDSRGEVYETITECIECGGEAAIGCSIGRIEERACFAVCWRTDAAGLSLFSWNARCSSNLRRAVVTGKTVDQILQRFNLSISLFDLNQNLTSECINFQCQLVAFFLSQFCH